MTGGSLISNGRWLALLLLLVGALLAAVLLNVAGITLPGFAPEAGGQKPAGGNPAMTDARTVTGVPQASPPCAGEHALQAGDYAAAYAIFSVQAATSPEAAFHLGEMYRDGLGVARNPQLAMRSFAVAAEAGEVSAMTALGLLFGESNDAWASYPEAISWLEQAALRGDDVAQGALARMVADGRGVERDPVRASAWLQVAERARAVRGMPLPPADQALRDALAPDMNTTDKAAVAAAVTEMENRVAATLAQRPKEAGSACAP